MSDANLAATLTSLAATHRSSFQVEILRLARPADRRRLEALLAADARLEVFDDLAGQLEELVETRAPSRIFAKGELARLAAEALAVGPAEEQGVWVYYPWSHRLVHLLDEAEFIELRTNRNHNKITLAEQARLASKRVGVVGLSVGQSVAVALAMERGCGELRIADFDRLGLSNLNRLRAGTHELGDHKTHITARQIAEIDPFFRVDCFSAGVDPDALDHFLLDGGKLDVVIDECDDFTVKLALRYRARELGIPVVMETSDRGLINVERFDREPSRPVLHGLVEGLDPQRLKNLTMVEKVQYGLRIVGENASPRLIASLIEVGESLRTWPQLASAVILGGGLTADVVRRMLLGSFNGSGRYFVDVEALVGDAPSTTLTSQTTTPTLPTTPTTTHASPPLADHLRQIIAAGCAAPSGGNAQPWRWIAEKQRLWLELDRARAGTFLDFRDSASLLALGAAAEHAVIAAQHLGFGVRLTAMPRGKSPDTVALLELTTESDGIEPPTFVSLYDAIAARCSNRKVGQRTPLQPRAREALEHAARSLPGAKLTLLESDAALAEIGAILGAGDRVRFLHHTLHAEMMSELRWSRDEAERTQDGVDLATLELSPADRAVLTLFRSWPAMQQVGEVAGGAALAKPAQRAVAGASAVALLSIRGNSARDYFEGGRALARVWLTATVERLNVQPLSALPYLFARLVRGDGEGFGGAERVALRELRRRYCALFDVEDTDAELLLFRLFEGDAPSVRSLRRPVEDVLASSGGAP